MQKGMKLKSELAWVDELGYSLNKDLPSNTR